MFAARKPMFYLWFSFFKHLLFQETPQFRLKFWSNGPLPYGHLVITARQNGHTISYKKPPLMRSPVNTAKGHILKSQTVDSLIIS